MLSAASFRSLFLSFVVTDVDKTFDILGRTFPAVAVYFLNVIIVKALTGLAFQVCLP